MYNALTVMFIAFRFGFSHGLEMVLMPLIDFMGMPIFFSANWFAYWIALHWLICKYAKPGLLQIIWWTVGPALSVVLWPLVKPAAWECLEEDAPAN